MLAGNSLISFLNANSTLDFEFEFFMYFLVFLQNGRGDICKVMNQYGHGKGTTQGGFSEYSVVKAKYCYPLKTDISYIDAVLLEPMGKNIFRIFFSICSISHFI